MGDGFGGMERDGGTDGFRSENEVVRSAVQNMRSGNRDAFEAIVELYQRRVFGLALMIVRDPSGAEEVVQDAFVSAYMHMDRYEESRPFGPWIVAIAVRHAQTWLRRHVRTSIHEGTELAAQPETPAPGEDPLDAVIADERGRRLWRRVAALPSAQRAVVVLYYQQDMKVHEIAGAMGVTGGTVKTLLFRARKILRRTLDGGKHYRLTENGKEGV